jgi:hypothetical protein
MDFVAYLPYIVLLIGVMGFIIAVVIKDGKLSQTELIKIVEVAVKAAELRYINSNGDYDRTKSALDTICNLMGIDELDTLLYENIMDIIDGIVNDLPKTSERLKSVI